VLHKHADWSVLLRHTLHITVVYEDSRVEHKLYSATQRAARQQLTNDGY
jgi:hypothetical protein